MRHQALNNLLRQFRAHITVREMHDFSDGELLDQFVRQRDEAAFAVLMQRHSAMVLGVCRRVLHHFQDAEDACQATFLVLARKVGSIARRESLSCWLHGVAYRVSFRLRADAARLNRQAQSAIEPVQTDALTAVTWQEAMQVLDEELNRLHAHYRAPLVLCYLEGKTQDEAAKQLGWTLGAFRGRLERGREKLRARLLRRGITFPAVLFGVSLASSAASASVPEFVMTSTVKAAAAIAAGQAAAVPISAKVVALTEGVLKTMLLCKLKTTSAVILMVALGAGLGAVSYEPSANAQDPIPARTAGGQANPAEQVAPIPQTVLQPSSIHTGLWRVQLIAEKSEQEIWKKASVDGKYSNLLKMIEVKSDLKNYMEFRDYGPWSGDSYAGHEKLPNGYWVYVYPHWYIWAAKDAPQQEGDKKASVAGQYSILLKKIELKADQRNYGEFRDFGLWTGMSYMGHEELPAGYWVYVAPHWYIWGAKDAPEQEDVKRASVGGKYSRLLKKFEVKGDRGVYTEFSDYGYSSFPKYAGHEGLPAGYWVYVSPYWYIWGETMKE